MNKRLSTTSAGSEPIPGYTLRKRLGSGGYGEVWQADAPGGLQKAIKFIYGNVDESRATGELRSLERIRQVNHPFLLSLERIEVVDGRVIIVTELAECSLLDRLELSRRKGEPGIPRAELLDFMRDTADALDFLAQKHSLQHLDVKPGNLLIIADRIKVADFGLVKDLHDTDQSIVGGLTPTYSAPEIFDGRPDYRSDQYSLAIVFMELLTGRLPFSGRTAGELARQHLNQVPDMEPLPPADRNIIRRALSKNPLDRYASCRQFVDQLLKVRSAALPVQAKAEQVNKNTSETTSTSHTQLGTDTRDWTVVRQSNLQQAIPRQQLAAQWIQSRAMFIGLGGQGVQALVELRNDLIHNVDDRLTCDDYQWLAIDTSPTELEIVTNGSSIRFLPADSAVRLPILSPQAYRKFEPVQFAPLSRRWLYNVPRSMRTEGVRPIATLSLIANYQAVCRIVEQKVAKLVQLHLQDQLAQTPLKVYVLASLHGGTGSALLGETGFIVRNAFAKVGFYNYRICGVTSAATTTNSRSTTNLPAANALATFSELVHWMDPQAEKPNIDFQTGFSTSNVRPFDWVTLIDGGLFEDRSAAEQNPRNIARHVALDCQSLTYAALSESRSEASSNGFGWLRTANSSTVQASHSWTPELIARWCCQRALASYTRFLSTTQTTESEQQRKTASVGSNSTNQLPLSDEACDELARRMLQEMGFYEDVTSVLSNPESIAQWARRLTQECDARQRQLSLDLSHWQQSICRIAQMRLYSWLQMERILMTVIRRYETYSTSHAPALSQQFAKFPAMLGDPQFQLAQVQGYLKELTALCADYCKHVTTGVRRLAGRFDDWGQTLADKSTAESSSQFDLAVMPTQIQLLCTRVVCALDAKLRAQLQSILKDAPKSLIAMLSGSVAQSETQASELPTSPGAQSSDIQPQVLTQGTQQAEAGKPEPPKIPMFESASQVLQLSQELVTKYCAELSISAEDFIDSDYHHNVATFDAIAHRQPMLATAGGSIFRFIVSADEHLPKVQQLIGALGIKSQTTLLPGPPSLATHLVCDAVNLNLPHIITSLWRPSSNTLNLAERLRTRVDIDWPSISQLFEREQLSTAKSESCSAPTAGPIVEKANPAPPLDCTYIMDNATQKLS